MRSLFDFAVPLLRLGGEDAREQIGAVSDDSVDPQGDKFPHGAFIVDRPHVHLYPGPVGSSHQLTVNNAQVAARYPMIGWHLNRVEGKHKSASYRPQETPQARVYAR